MRLAIGLLSVPLLAQVLGPPVMVTDPPGYLGTIPVQPRVPFSSSSWFDTSSRSAIQNAYQTIWTPTNGTTVGWTGSVANNAPGTTSQTYQEAVLTRVNWVRALAGVPANIVFDSTFSNKDQQAALMMSSNNSLSHTPPSSWLNYTAGGAEAAGKSNLCLGYPLSADPGCVLAYMIDDGANNTAVGHRRWLLVPQTQLMGTGDVTQTPLNSFNPTYSNANAVWVQDGHFGDSRPATRDGFVAWPPKGYVPYRMVPTRWSISYPNANFNSATVTMTQNGVNIPVTQLTPEPSPPYYIGENTLVWIPNTSFSGVPATDTTIQVSVTGITGVALTQFQYNVVVFDPATSGTPDQVVAPVLTFPSNAATGVSPSGTSLVWLSAAGATSYDVRFGASNPPAFLANTTGGSINSGGLNPSTTYYWQVVAKNASSTAESAVLSFTTADVPLLPPVLASPPNGSSAQPLNIALAWNASVTATSYEVYLGTSSNPVGATTTTELSYSPAGLSPGVTYYWRVVARNQWAVSSSSPTWSFTTTFGGSVGTPGLSSPANGSNQYSSPQLTWSPAVGATSYDVYFGTSSSPGFMTNSVGTTASPGPLQPSTTYYWKVVAKNASTNASSAVWSFNTGGVPTIVSPTGGSTGVPTPTTLNWTAGFGAATYDVYFGTTNPPPLVGTTANLSYAANGLTSGTRYYWKVAVTGSPFNLASPVVFFDTASSPSNSSALQFIPVAPCRVIDTRAGQGTTGLFGPPSIGPGTRSVPIPQGRCNIPASAKAYSLNITVAPANILQYLTVFPTGQSQPVVSTLNAFNGGVVANAAVVPAGANGAVSFFATELTDLIVDINGYFDSTGLAFYASTPCRVADTRNPVGTFGGPTPNAGQSRDFPIPASSCTVPGNAQAYSTNATVVPQGALYYLTLWPTGQAQPFVSTLNAFDGRIAANAAIVPTGANGGVSAFVSNKSDVILDLNGYFAPPGSANGLNFYSVTPCRVTDTRGAQGPILTAGSTRTIDVPSSNCGIPANAKAYALNVTVVPEEALGYLTTWPNGQSRPNVSTLNSDGRIVANAAIVPAGTAGAIDVFVTNRTHVILDINGYFAP